MAKTVAVDYETYSSVDIKRGVYAYTESPDFEILLVAYSIDGGEVVQFCPGDGSKAESEYLAALEDSAVLLTAYNANFERICSDAFYHLAKDPDRWRCTMVLASTLGLPRSLDAVGAAMGLPSDERKLRAGRALIQYFCKPCKPTAANSGRTRNRPADAPEKWELFCRYNLQDVVTEQAIRRRLLKYAPNQIEQALWSLDQRINDRGVHIDGKMAAGIVAYDAQSKEALTAEAQSLTGLSNPNSLAQLKSWMAKAGQPGLAAGLDKAAITDALTGGTLPAKVRRVLEIRQQLGKTSTKKYDTMLASLCKDGTVKGSLQFYGANRTGRWAGRILQLQNLPQNHIPDLALAHDLAHCGDFDALELLYGNTAQVFSELVRTALLPSEGCRFVVSDFSAIEARVIAWLAGEEWRLDVFKNGGDIYCASASKMFGVPVEKHGQNAHLRQRGKVAELALGYGGGVGAMKRMDTSNAIPGEDMPGIVSDWRDASPHITQLWHTLESAAKKAITQRVRVKALPLLGVQMSFCDGKLFIRLPSGRCIAYYGAAVEDGEKGERITYMGVDQNTHKWARVDTYGGKLTENVVQATARDCLAVKMLQADALGYHIIAHVHDEMIIDVPNTDIAAAETIDRLMAQPIDWAPGLPLKGGTYECPYYQKD